VEDRREDQARNEAQYAVNCEHPCLPPFPKPATSKKWLDFLQTIEHYLSTTTHSPGGDGSLAETETHRATSKCLTTTMLGKLSGGALTLFKKTGRAYTKKGFKKLTALKTLFSDKSILSLSLKMFEFFKKCLHGDILMVAYKAKLHTAFE
jgi:hypothetical protein